MAALCLYQRERYRLEGEGNFNVALGKPPVYNNNSNQSMFCAVVNDMTSNNSRNDFCYQNIELPCKASYHQVTSCSEQHQECDMECDASSGVLDIPTPASEIGIQEEDSTRPQVTCTNSCKNCGVQTLLQKCEILQDIYEKYEISNKSRTCDKKRGKVKRKKWKLLNNEDFGIRESLFPRPVQDNTEIYQSNEELFYKIEEECDKIEEIVAPFQNELMLEGQSVSHELRFIRADKDRKVQKIHKQVKTKYCNNVRNNNGRKRVFIHHRVFKLISLEMRRMCYMPSKKKEKNIANREEVNRNGIKRAVLAPRAPVQSLAHALDNNNAPADIDREVINVLINLQHRDLTPEDYDLLLRLDESVAPKTVSESTINNFKVDEVDAASAGELCAICMEAYEVGQKRKFLPCNHVFHEKCITMWLSCSSLNCPIDNLPVES